MKVKLLYVIIFANVFALHAMGADFHAQSKRLSIVEFLEYGTSGEVEIDPIPDTLSCVFVTQIRKTPTLEIQTNSIEYRDLINISTTFILDLPTTRGPPLA